MLCLGSACDECARDAIISSEGSKCPLCGEQANPEELIPYRLFRDRVDKFQNQTGYVKKTREPPPPAAIATFLPLLLGQFKEDASVRIRNSVAGAGFFFRLQANFKTGSGSQIRLLKIKLT